LEAIMNFGSSHPDPDDYFSDTRMSFGDHIEELRMHLWKAIIGFAIAVAASFAIGRPVLRFIAAPVEKELQAYWDRYYAKKLAEFERESRDSANAGPPVEITLQVPREQFPGANKDQRAKPPLNLAPPFRQWMRNFGLDDWINDQQGQTGEVVELRAQIKDPRPFIAGMQPFLQKLGKRPALATLNVQEGFVVFVQVCLVTGFVIASPWVFYQIWSFIAAGLYPHEKRYVNVFLPVSLSLFLVGVLLCQFVVIPQAVHALLWFNEWLQLEPELRLNEWLSFAILVPLVFGLSFQTPLVMLFLERIGVMTIEKFRNFRKYAWFFLCLFAAIVIPTFDIATMLMLWLPMCLLYELGIWMCLLSPKRPALDDDEVPKSEELIEV
jgi:sec-independent protein translocase protein TatC